MNKSLVILRDGDGERPLVVHVPAETLEMWRSQLADWPEQMTDVGMRKIDPASIVSIEPYEG